MQSKRVNLLKPSEYRPQDSDSRGSILILALWSVALLSVFAVILNYATRQKIALVQRLDLRDKLSLVAEAGVKKAIIEISKPQEPKTYFALKDQWNNDMNAFKDVSLGDCLCNVSYAIDEQRGGSLVRWGLIDEERKVNINLADSEVMKRLLQVVTSMDETQAQDLAAAIIDWRDSDDMLSSPSGGAESPYYRNLSHPYEAKNSEFQVLDELLLVKGMNQEIFERLKDYITIYGEGKININTVSRPVLLALGLSPATVDKVLLFRNGKDGIEATADDNVFDSPSNIVTSINQAYPLDTVEKAQLTQVAELYLSTSSNYFMIKSRATIPNRKDNVELISVIDNNGKILYWNQS